MIFKKHHIFLVGVAMVIFSFMASSQSSGLEPSKFLATCFFIFVVGWTMGLVQGKKGHPLVDDLEDTPREKIRLKEKTWRQHQALFLFIAPLRDAGASWDDIQAKAQTELGPEYPSSIDTLKDVYQKGKNGFYKNFPKTS